MRAVSWGGLIVGLLLSASVVAADPAATVTLIEGSPSIIRGTERYALAEGVRLATGDIIETGEKGLMEIEFPDGTRLSLGPGSRLLALALERDKVAAEFHIVTATLKHAAAKQPAGAYRYSTATLTLVPTTATFTAILAESDSAAFIESGEAQAIEPAPKGATATPIRLRTNDFYARKGNLRSTVVQQPSQAFVAALPRSFLDPLPSRMARYKDRDVAPKPLGEVTYEEVAYWLEAPWELRRPFFSRFLKRARDPAFRAGIVAHMRAHPEWDRVLFPEKYKPKEESVK